MFLLKTLQFHSQYFKISVKKIKKEPTTIRKTLFGSFVIGSDLIYSHHISGDINASLSQGPVQYTVCVLTLMTRSALQIHYGYE
jgi:hypothetical protein